MVFRLPRRAGPEQNPRAWLLQFTRTILRFVVERRPYSSHRSLATANPAATQNRCGAFRSRSASATASPISPEPANALPNYMNATAYRHFVRCVAWPRSFIAGCLRSGCVGSITSGLRRAAIPACSGGSTNCARAFNSPVCNGNGCASSLPRRRSRVCLICTVRSLRARHRHSPTAPSRAASRAPNARRCVVSSSAALLSHEPSGELRRSSSDLLTHRSRGCCIRSRSTTEVCLALRLHRQAPAP
jgi:hypothetical protein